MRNSFVKAAGEIFESNDKTVLLLGDIGAFLLKDIKEKYPNRFYNMGAAEAAMMSVAVGMALDGWIPFVYTITPFVTSRCFDQIRVGAGYHNANVKIVGVGSGVSYGSLGSTHHSIEDLALMRSVPNMTVLSPSDGPETAKATKAAAEHVGPVYLRLGLKVPDLPREGGVNFKIGRAEVIKSTRTVAIISTGDLVRESLGAAEMLEKEGVNVVVVNVSTIKPLDTTTLGNVLSNSYAAVTVEEHSIYGGLGSAVSEIVSKMDPVNRPRFEIMGIEDKFLDKYGKRDQVLKYLGLDSVGIYEKIKELL
jgi:transketolase